MKKLLLTLILVLVAPMASTAPEEVLYPDVQRITAEDLKEMIKGENPPVIVDTRDSVSYDYGHIPGAINIYYDPTADPMTREMMLIALPMDRLVVIYCPCPNEEDSGIMVRELVQLGYEPGMVKALLGGNLVWEDRGYPLIGEINEEDS